MNAYNSTALALTRKRRNHRSKKTIDCKKCIDYYMGGCLCSHEVGNIKEIKARKCFKPKVKKK